MKKFITTLCALALTVTVANAQTTKGTMTFGISDNFTTASTGTDANVGYFVMDGIMVSANFHMDMADEGETNWGFGARYYYGDDGLWGGLSAKNGHDHETEEDTVDMMVQVGYSKALGMDGKLWFEPTLDYDMAGDGSLGLGAGFRLAF
ncbi:MAG: hypothetical protein CMP57_05380 [Flavobacteriales bacterium]|jgi:hypothetical protein|nr:hypothetical protein [Flavobacteriales bacterium]|tara:strand:+ start:726 stop:1172 length:447 start_codon:yes stop_codon:yes gene_type:complete